jgi:UDP-N-acetylmuramate dehydrogenase
MVLAEADPDTRSAGSFFTNPVVSTAQYGELAARFAPGSEAGRAGASAREPGARAGIPHWPASDGQVKMSAAWLIEHAGFSKGWRLPDDPDGARISTKHALALTNPGQATAAGLIRLAREIQAGVRAAFGVTLTNEPVLVGVEL